MCACLFIEMFINVYTHTHAHTAHKERAKKALRLFIAKLNVIIFHLIIFLSAQCEHFSFFFYCHAHTNTSGCGGRWSCCSGRGLGHIDSRCFCPQFSLNCRVQVSRNAIGHANALIASCRGDRPPVTICGIYSRLTGYPTPTQPYTLFLSFAHKHN